MEHATEHTSFPQVVGETPRILVVDDEKSAAEFFGRTLRKQNCEVMVTTSFGEAVSALKANEFAVVIVDIQLDNVEGTALLPWIKETNPTAKVIFVTGHGSVDSAVDAIHQGAFDYISKPVDLIDIEENLKRAVARALQQRLALSPKKEEIPSAMQGRSIVGKSPQMVRIYTAIAKAALTREHVLITGESGTGKELVAHAIHKKSPWADRPFVTVNCCALTETLLESELFGHLRGSFTGATANKKGLFEEANGGTIFLDEIGDIPLSLQVKLLRAIQEGEIKPVGSAETRSVDVRVVAATHRDLLAYVKDGKFREDLYYRLKVIPIEIPPLRERKQDLPDLIDYFVAKYSQKTGKMITGVSDEAMEFLLSYPWPGNIRELENAFGRATAMTSTTQLFPEDFPPEITQYGNATDTKESAPSHSRSSSSTHSESGQESLEDVEKRHILRTLESVNYNKSRAAEILGIDRVTLYRKAFKYGLLQKKSAGVATPAESSTN